MASDISQKIAAFIASLENLLDRMNQRDSSARATIAKLKRGLGKDPGTCIDMFPFVIPRIEGIEKEKDQNAFFMVAALFAAHQKPENNKIRNLGSYFKKISNKKKDSESIEKRFLALLNSHYDELFRHLRHAVSLGKSLDIPIDFKVLLWDIIRWDDSEKKVQKNWAKSYWSTEETK